MRNIFTFVISLFIVLPVLASEKSLKSIGLEASDSTGCYLSNGKEIVGPTIGLMVAAYNDSQTILKNDQIKKIILGAIESGCDINEPDRMGLSPLNAAILFNQAEMVTILLSKGANPKNKIVSPKPNLNGLNSYQFVDFLISKKQRRPEIKKLLTDYGTRN